MVSSRIGIVLWVALAAAASTPCAAGTIQVQGQGEVRYVPEYADVSFSVGAHQPSARAAFVAARDVAERVLALCREMGIGLRDVRTNQVSLRIAWKEENEKPVFDGYNASISIAVRVRDSKQIEPLTLRILELGVNESTDVSFGTDSSRRYRDEARLMALRAAREKAQAMAKELGQTLEEAQSVVVDADSDNVGTPSRRPLGSNYMTVDSGEGRASGSLALGEQAATARVTVVFGLK